MYLRSISTESLDFRGGDDLDVDAFAGKHIEHLGRDPGLRAHPDPDDRDLGDVFVGDKVVEVDAARRLRFLHRLLGACHLADGAGEGHVGAALLGDVLHDHVDVHAGIRKRPEDRGGDPGAVGHGNECHLGFVARIGDPGNGVLFHDFLLVADQRACIGVVFSEARQHPELHVVAHGQLDRAGLQHFGAERGEFQHFLESDLVELAGLVLDPGVGGVDPVDVSVDVAALGVEGGGEGHCRGVRSAAAERGDAVVFGDPLEARDHGHAHALAELGEDIVRRDRLDPGGGMHAGCLDRHLPALPAARRDVHFLQPKRHQPGGDILARADNGIVFARVVEGRGFLDPTDKLVGPARHRRDDDDHVIAVGHFACDALRGPGDPVERGDGGAAEFHHENGHGRERVSVLQVARLLGPVAKKGKGATRKVRFDTRKKRPVRHMPRWPEGERNACMKARAETLKHVHHVPSFSCLCFMFAPLCSGRMASSWKECGNLRGIVPSCATLGRSGRGRVHGQWRAGAFLDRTCEVPQPVRPRGCWGREVRGGQFTLRVGTKGRGATGTPSSIRAIASAGFASP